MKKGIVIFVLFCFSFVFGQEKEAENSIQIGSLGSSLYVGKIGSVGVFYEHYWESCSNYVKALGLEVNSLVAEVPQNGLSYGNGLEARIGYKMYLVKQRFTGFYLKSSLVYGTINFDENNNSILVNSNYNGKYSYFSVFSPELGYDFLMVKKLRVGFNLGTQWQLETKGTRDVDNQDFDNWIFRAGLRLSYDFHFN